MNESASIFQSLISEFQNIISLVLSYLPKVAVSIVVIVIGWLIARLLRLLVVRTASLGQDPAQSSSIILTTVTDVVGFFSFLGIATLLSGML